ncbi:MAG TPA: metal-dependent hydrolase [Bryobacteraceae bacterium]|nr:metal-dependent hydrolase [Bryobacteraceae bacterium]
MDNLTHALTGVLLSRAGLNRLSPKANWLLVLAANVPDIDILALAGGTDLYFEHHRGITHALVMIPVMALLPVLFVRFVLRQKLSWVRALLASSVGVASHLLLDWTNSYGIRLWLPFSDSWPALDITSVIDLFIWTTLAIAVLAPVLSRLVSSEIGAKKTSGRGWAIAGLVLLLLYDCGRLALRDRAIAIQEARLYQGRPPARTLVFPTPLNPALWEGLIETDRFWALHTVNLASEFDPSASRVIYKPESSPAIAAAKATHVFQVMESFSRALQYTSAPSGEVENGVQVEARDLRFGFRAIAILDSRNAVQRAWFSY